MLLLCFSTCRLSERLTASLLHCLLSALPAVLQYFYISSCLYKRMKHASATPMCVFAWVCFMALHEVLSASSCLAYHLHGCPVALHFFYSPYFLSFSRFAFLCIYFALNLLIAVANDAYALWIHNWQRC